MGGAKSSCVKNRSALQPPVDHHTDGVGQEQSWTNTALRSNRHLVQQKVGPEHQQRAEAPAARVQPVRKPVKSGSEDLGCGEGPDPTQASAAPTAIRGQAFDVLTDVTAIVLPGYPQTTVFARPRRCPRRRLGPWFSIGFGLKCMADFCLVRKIAKSRAGRMQPDGVADAHRPQHATPGSEDNVVPNNRLSRPRSDVTYVGRHTNSREGSERKVAASMAGETRPGGMWDPQAALNVADWINVDAGHQGVELAD